MKKSIALLCTLLLLIGLVAGCATATPAVTTAAPTTTAGGTRDAIGKPAFTRARICDEEMPSGKPASQRPRNGAGNGCAARPGRGIATNSTSRANSSAARHFGNCGR